MVGLAAISSDEVFSSGGQTLTAAIVIMAVLGAIVRYVMSLLSLFALRKKEPLLARPCAARGYPVVPAIAAVLDLATRVGLRHAARGRRPGPVRTRR